MNKCARMSEVTTTGRMKTWRKYILVTVCPEIVVPANIAVATQPPIKGVLFAMLIPIVAAPNARLSHGRRYPD